MRPLFAGNGGNAPLVFVFERVAIGLYKRILSHARLGNLFVVGARKSVGVVGVQP